MSCEVADTMLGNAAAHPRRRPPGGAAPAGGQSSSTWQATPSPLQGRTVVAIGGAAGAVETGAASPFSVQQSSPTSGTSTSSRRRTLRRLGLGIGAIVAVMCVSIAVRAIAMDLELRRGASELGGAADGLPSLKPGTIPILMPAYGRPEYVAEVLDGVARMEGVGETVLVVSLDGDNQEVIDLVNSVTALPVVLLRHWRPYWGVPTSFLQKSDYTTASNVFFLLRFAFERLHVPHAIMLESDLVPAADMYQYFKWMAHALDTNSTLRDMVFTVNGYNMASREGASPISLAPYGFTVWGWMCPGSSWPLIRDGWTWFHNWDITVDRKIRPQSGRVSLTPDLSRVRNIGMRGINFDVQDEAQAEPWKAVYMNEGGEGAPRVDYNSAKPDIRWSEWASGST